jgi:hypothetical protein
MHMSGSALTLVLSNTRGWRCRVWLTCTAAGSCIGTSNRTTCWSPKKVAVLCAVCSAAVARVLFSQLLCCGLATEYRRAEDHRLRHESGLGLRRGSTVAPGLCLSALFVFFHAFFHAFFRW